MILDSDIILYLIYSMTQSDTLLGLLFKWEKVVIFGLWLHITIYIPRELYKVL